MPLYEYYCESCNGVFEQLRSMRESSEPSSCPLCDRDSQRIMPTSFQAYIFRDGMPRKIPDRGTYWHWGGQEVKTMIDRAMPPNEHPELYHPDPGPTPTRGDREYGRDIEYYKQRHATRMKGSDFH